MNNDIKKKIKKAKKKLAEGFMDNIKDSDPKTWMSKMNKLGRAAYENNSSDWKFVNETKDDIELTEDIAEHFAKISRDFHPIDRNLLPIPDIHENFVSEVNCFPEEFEVFELMKKAKKTSSVPHGSSHIYPSGISSNSSQTNNQHYVYKYIPRSLSIPLED